MIIELSILVLLLHNTKSFEVRRESLEREREREREGGGEKKKQVEFSRNYTEQQIFLSYSLDRSVRLPRRSGGSIICTCTIGYTSN